MNKYKKIASAVVSMVLAGSMVGSMAACDTGSGPSGYNLKVKLDAENKLTYAEGTTLNLNIGDNDSTTPAQISFQAEKDISGKSYLIDGKSYTSGNLKPAWQAVSENLGLTLKDKFANVSSDKQIEDPITKKTLGQYDIISGSLSAINQNSGNNNFVNLADYLDYMPNYSKFLEENPVTIYSLTGDASATSKNAGAMYAAPYLDGNNDIENYVLIRKDWVRGLLDKTPGSNLFVSFAEQARIKDTPSGGGASRYNSIVGETPSIKSYMGKTKADNYDIEVVNKESGEVETITVDYDAALKAVKATGNALYETLLSVDGVDDAAIQALTSGNIVDIQNLAIEKSHGEVNGSVLAKLVREYIKVAYLKDGSQYYTTLSDVFNSVAAAWDVDLLAATLRAVVTIKAGATSGDFTEVESGNVYGIVAREPKTQRRVNLYSLAAQLYGIRGMESRLEYLYIDNNGDLRDARQDAESYDLLDNFSKFAKEGILYTGKGGVDGQNSYYSGTGTDSVLGAVAYDYVQTQTRYQMVGGPTPAYDFAPILTPVSKWDVDGDGNHTDIMRFTESWRSVKNTGFCVPSAAVANNPDKLSAVLTLIDYMFSEDGQMLLTYGTPSSSDSYDEAAGTSSDNGWWYAEEAEGLTLDTVAEVKVQGYGKVPTQYKVKDEYIKQVFVYEGKVYKGEVYGGRVVPKITKANRAFFQNAKITVTPKDNGSATAIQMGSGNLKIQEKGNYTGYARRILGTTMPIGNKNQGFEYQCTSQCGKDGADIVDKAVQAKVIKHVVTDPKKAESPWYFISPTVYPLAAGSRTTLNNSAQTFISAIYFVNNKDAETNVYIDILLYGLSSTTFLGKTTNIADRNDAGTLKASGSEYITFLNSGNINNALNIRVNIYKKAWGDLKTFYKIDEALKIGS